MEDASGVARFFMETCVGSSVFASVCDARGSFYQWFVRPPDASVGFRRPAIVARVRRSSFILDGNPVLGANVVVQRQVIPRCEEGECK